MSFSPLSTILRTALMGLALSWGGAAAAQAPASQQIAALSPAETALVEQAEDYLNSFKTMRARFMQVAPNGGVAEGQAYLSRPGKMRLDYDPPSQIEIIANGSFLIYHDKELEQVSYLGLDETPAGILVRPNIDLNGRDLSVTGVTQGRGLVQIGLVQSGESAGGELTLVFNQNPFVLRQWMVRDPQGNVTTVSLFNTRTGVALNPKLFDFRDPYFFRNNDR